MSYKLPLVLGLLAISPLSAVNGCGDPDEDYDGLTNSVDNCDLNYNPAQTDTNGDGAGDACDASTPMLNVGIGGCYSSDWPPLRGVNWEDRETLIEQGDVDPSALFVSVDWTSSDSDWIERGEGSTNGSGVWFDIRDEHNPYLYTRTIVEGLASDTNNDGQADEIHGTFVMLECEATSTTCDMESDPYVVWTDGNWDAVRINSIDCNRL